MRTIKFRGKREPDGMWVFGDLETCSLFSFARIHQYNDDGTYCYQHRVDRSTVGQFTGLTDRNGREIYEGDILLWTRKNVHIEGRTLQDLLYKCKVYYDNDKCAFQFRCKLKYGACVGNLDFDDDRADESYIEIIGNVFDNPELLEEGGG